MSQTDGSERVLARMVAWATDRDDVRAIVVVGSHARSDHPADRYSDLDCIVTARRPARHLEDTDWIGELGTPWLVVPAPTVVGGERILHATFEGGAKADVVFVSSRAFALGSRALEQMAKRPWLRAVLPAGLVERLATLSDLLDRGFRVALDKDGIGERLAGGALPSPPPRTPSRREFDDLVKLFLNEQISFASKIRRGELFVVKTLGETRLMELLLEMIEWHTRTTSDRWSPVFEHGRFLEEWAAPSVVEGLRSAFARYDAAELWRARLATHDLFRQLARETGERLGYAYPAALDERVMGWVRAQVDS